MKRKLLPAAGLLLLLFFSMTMCFSCAGLTFSYKKGNIRQELGSHVPSYPAAHFAVISDPHFYDISLGTEGEDFREYLDNDRKMLVHSEEIFLEAINKIKEEAPDFVIIAGDLTKDGEKQSHRLFAAHLTSLENNGIPVYLVPGNHDILNPHAVRFIKTGRERVETVSPEEFSLIYAEYGYNEALARDPSSLSYVAEPADGLWLLALDSAYYEDNFEKDYPQTGGRFTQEEINWIETVLLRAAEQDKAVIAFMHHGILEHYDSQEKYFGEYLVKNYKAVAEMLARYKVRLCFTGHYHAQDITVEHWDENTFIYDIETGSLVTYPCPVRFVTMDNSGSAVIRSELITAIPSFSAAEKDFYSFAKEYVYTGIEGIAVRTMIDLNMKKEEAEMLSSQIADAFVAHYQGDEKFSGDTMISTEGLSFMGKMVVGNRKALIHGLWRDKEPADNNVIINLHSGY
jgi:UDP-2,3-diacylglucosamine pyrophosphatase LpxH